MTRAADIDVRPITEAEFPDWNRAVNIGFLREPTLTEDQLATREPWFVPGRLLGAFDGDRCVATFRSFDQQLTAVGGAAVRADAVTNVTVSPTHRRRGILGRMMERDLAAAKERGDVVATLIAAEYPIYGRYGFGPATTAAEWTIDVPRTGLDPRWSGPDDGGRIDLVDASDVRKLGPELHDRLRRVQPGAVSRDDLWWQITTGTVQFFHAFVEPHYAVYRSPAGVVEGMVAYTSDDRWGDGKQPLNTAKVKWLMAVSPAAERALWRYLCSIDWITAVRTGWRAPDDLVPHLFPDPRAARITGQADWLWVRILDVVRAMEARTYAGAGSLVLDVVDGGGRYRVEADADGAGACAATTDSADLTITLSDLAALWLGDESAVRLTALGRAVEERAGAAQVADALLRTSRRPWCPDVF
ncbi:GNAT family N-acetyltransferase [Streptomyces sp. NPDC057798]|uniref:GNAT family N-acetyltransferase n=1 Tax=Streptomyces sp. NPDC057798 TaxID=3346252 RepID=UPI0036AE433C